VEVACLDLVILKMWKKKDIIREVTIGKVMADLSLTLIIKELN
jgi:hypothetical protein